MDLRPYRASAEQVSALKGLIGYQPYILSDDVQTGIADIWIHKSGIKSVRRSDVTPEEWTRFCASNARLRAMYDGWIDAIAQATGPLEGKTVVITGSIADPRSGEKVPRPVFQRLCERAGATTAS